MPAAAFIAVVSLIAAGPEPAAQRAAPRPAVQLIGIYDNIRSTEEHIYGYELELWRVQGSLVGIWALHEGLIGDSGMTVQVADLKLDERRRTLSFTARLCSLVQSFEGRLASDGVAGTVTNRGPKGVLDVQSVQLKPSNGEGFQRMPTDATEWKARTAGRLERRGPDCGPLVIGK